MNEKANDKLSKNAVVCFLDVLGFKTLLHEHDAFFIHEAFEVLLTSTYDLKTSPHSGFLIKDVRVRIFSDSIIIVLEETDNVLSAIEFYEFLKFVSVFNVLFIQFTGYFLRGGIAVGTYQERKIYNEINLFINSSALNTAVELEKNANVPRVLIDRKSVNKMNLTTEKSKSLILSGSDSYLYLDIYEGHGFGKYTEDIIQWTSEMQGHVEKQCSTNVNHRSILDKYRWFQKYHNSKIEELIKKDKIPESTAPFIKDLPYNL